MQAPLAQDYRGPPRYLRPVAGLDTPHRLWWCLEMERGTQVMHDQSPSPESLNFAFRNEKSGLSFTAVSANVSPSRDIVFGLGQAEGDLNGTYAYEVRLGARGLRFALKGDDGEEVFSAEAGHPATGQLAKEIALLQQPGQPVCTCRATVMGTTQEGTLLNIDICPGCNLAASVVHIEAGFADLIFDATAPTSVSCAPTTLGLQLVAEGTGITNRCGPVRFIIELINQRLLSYVVLGQGCIVAEVENTPLPLVEPCVPERRIRGLGTRAARL